MRTGSCAVQQGLTSEAANIVKQAVTLAKRRGHAQVTPLHVASTMLSLTNGLFRTACLQSNSHPLQCKALELCFNVALNRLPASSTTSSSSGHIMLGTSTHHHHHHHSSPSISNALVAAFKRAQAHQRRGSVENQQQQPPLLAVKIELEQLIISILDDPSVSRVMREAGFSSTQVKSNVEQAVSLEICSQNNASSKSKSKENNNSPSSHHQGDGDNNIVGNKTLVVLDDPIVRVDDVMSVVDSLVSQRKRSIVVVGECLSSLEGVVRGVMDKVEKGDVDESLRGVKFVPLSLSSFGHVSRVEVEKKVEELRSLSKMESHGKGCVLYLGDLKWVFDYYKANSSKGRGYYCPVDHMVMEIAKLVSGVGEINEIRFWLMGIATFQSYMRCKNGQPSLETVWNLHPITIPAGSLCLSLITDSGLKNQPTNTKADNRTSWLLHEGVGDEQKKQPPCFAENSAKIETQVIQSLQSSTCNSDSSSSSLPAWLQQYKNENRGVTSINDQNCVPMGELCKKWNYSMCSATQKQPYPFEKTHPLSSSGSPSSSTSGFSNEQQHPNFHQRIYHDFPVAEPTHHFLTSHHDNGRIKPNEPILRVYIPESNNKHPIFSSSNPNSTSSSDVMEMEHYTSKFKEFNSENLKTLCNALEEKVPWQKDIIPEIVSTVLQGRSGMLRRKGKVMRRSNEVKKEETWLFFQGVDIEGKEKIARELARVVFGSQNKLISIALSSFADSSEDSSRNKRSRDEPSYCSYIERFGDAVSCDPHRVFLVEDIEQADYCSQLGFKRAIEKGRVEDSNGEEVGLCDAIIILSCESFTCSRSRACSPSMKQKTLEGSREEKDDNDVVATLEETSPFVSLDLNISIHDDECDGDQSLDDEIGLLESVDRKVMFKNIQEL